jgi:type 1 fimbria pilin
MKKVLLVGIAVIALAVSATLLLAADKTVTVKGEVVDTMCYASMGARGESHAKCGIGCAKKGIPVGLVEGNKMYILLPAKDDTGLPAAVVDHMGKVVQVTGKTYSAGGNTFLTVDSVK